MSEMEKRENCSRYETMTTEELQEILRQRAHNKSEADPDTQELFEIMEVLSARRQNSDLPAFRSDEDAFAEFCEYYMPKEKEEARTIRFPNRVLKPVAAVLAAVLILAVGTTVTAKAFHIDIWSRIANWTKDIFQFSDRPQDAKETLSNQELPVHPESLQEALDMHMITEKLIPTWLPEGYACKDVQVLYTPQVRSFVANYQKGDEVLLINIHQNIGVPASRIEKSDNPVEVYVANGIEYYIFLNDDTLQAAWSIHEFECVIAGNITLEEMHLMIHSI